MDLIEEYTFKHPFTCLIAGPTKSGKTTLLKKILTNHEQMISHPIDRIVYCYSRWQDAFDELQNSLSIEFKEGLPDIEDFDSKKNNLLILDDLMRESCKDNSIYDIFTVDSHHKNISVFFLTQNLFPKEKNARTISLNCNYIITTSNPRDRAQLFNLARQMYPNNMQFLLESFKDSMDKPYGYTVLDLTQTTPGYLRVQTGICPGEERIIYQEK
jgi:GTPase SAR1 family protein